MASQWDSRLDGMREHFGGEPFSRKSYLQLYKTITPVTASRDMKAGVDAGLLIRDGDKRTAVYRFARAAEHGTAALSRR